MLTADNPDYRTKSHEITACQEAIWAIRDDPEFPLPTRFEAAKWSAFIGSGFSPDKPLYLPDELYGDLKPDDRNRHLRLWAAKRADMLLRYGMDKQMLRATKEELNRVVACIMQTDAAQAASFTGKLGRAITAKLAGAGASAGLLGLASAVGTASTGTAIGTLSGAALVSSQLAWIGAFVGGGMAAGTILTGGLAVLVGVATFWLFNIFKTKPRQYDDLPELDRQIVDKCSWVIQAIDEEIERDEVRSWALQEKVFREHIVSLYDTLVENEDDIAVNLDEEYKTNLSKYVIPEFKHNVIDAYSSTFERVNLPHLLFKERAAMVIVTTVLWKLWKQEFTFTTNEEQLVIEALRRSNSSLANADLSELGGHVGAMEPDQLKGLANSVKGIYHELRFVEEFNSDNPTFIAELHPDTNQPGSDVVIRDLESGEIVQEAQLKATESNQYILEHFERYPDIAVFATAEVAEEMEGVTSSGMSDPSLESDVSDVIDQLKGFGPFDEAMDAAAIGGLVGLLLYGAGSDKEKMKAKEAGKRALEGAGIAAGTTAVISYLFS